MKHGVIVTLALVWLVGCSAKYVDNRLLDRDAQIRQSDDAFAILALMEDYEHAMKELNLELLRPYVSRDYYENAGTTDTTRDDYGYQGVSDLFEALREHAQDVRVQISISDIVIDHDRADVFYEYAFTMLFQVGEQARWETGRDLNRIQLQREDGHWRIISGL